MRQCNISVLLCALALFAAFCGRVRAGITLGQLDDFQNQSLSDWRQGPFSPNPPSIVTTGGPTGAGDAYMQSVSTGISDAGGRQAVLNTIEWTGDFPGAGVTAVNAEMANFGTSALNMRIGIEDVNGTRYVSTTAVPLAADGLWHALTFGITATDLTQVSGTETADQALSTVTAFRFMSASTPVFQADIVASTLGIDDIHAVPEPMGLGALVLAVAAIAGRRRRA